MSDVTSRSWHMYVEDMKTFIQRAMSYTAGMEYRNFLESGITYDATIRNIELIGEAATKIPAEIRARFPDVPWRMVIATRNRLIHGYLGIDDDVLWNIIRNELPSLLDALSKIDIPDNEL